MAITVVFTTSQVVGEPSEIVLVDASTGSDASATQRRIYLQTATGDYLVPTGTSTDYINWPIADGNTKTLDVLTKDYALNITVMYLNVSNVSVAETTDLAGFTLYSETFYYSLTQAQASQSQPPPMIIQDSNYYMNKLALRTSIDSGNNAITYGDDITTAQNMYDLATYMVLNEADYF